MTTVKAFDRVMVIDILCCLTPSLIHDNDPNATSNATASQIKSPAPRCADRAKLHLDCKLVQMYTIIPARHAMTYRAAISEYDRSVNVHVS